MLDNALYRYSVLALCACLFIACDTLAANWGKTGAVWSLIAVILLAPIAYVIFGYLNQRYALSVSSGWIVLAISVSSVLIGIFYFHDQLNFRQGIGVVLAIISAALILT